MQKNSQCLMLETKDQRRFFTHKKNLPLLVEFSNTFEADISVVKLKEEAEVLDLIRLAPAICNPEYKQKGDFEVVEKKITHGAEKKKSNAGMVRDYIKDQFLAGRVVELRDIAEHFKQSGLSLASFCNYLSQVRSQMVKEGYSFTKTGGGKYQMNSQSHS